MRAGRRWPRTLTDGNARVRRYTRLVLIVCLLPLAAGCTPKPDMGEAVDLHRQMGPRGEPPPVPELEPAPGALGPEAPYLPLVQPPQVQRVWITAHLNDDGDLIAGHWVYLMLAPSQWFLRGYRGDRVLKLKLPAPK